MVWYGFLSKVATSFHFSIHSFFRKPSQLSYPFPLRMHAIHVFVHYLSKLSKLSLEEMQLYFVLEMLDFHVLSITFK